MGISRVLGQRMEMVCQIPENYRVSQGIIS